MRPQLEEKLKAPVAGACAAQIGHGASAALQGSAPCTHAQPAAVPLSRP